MGAAVTAAEYRKLLHAMEAVEADCMSVSGLVRILVLAFVRSALHGDSVDRCSLCALRLRGKLPAK